MTRARRIAVWLLLLAAGFGATAHAQYFGQNKVQYQSFDFQILHTEHFDIYFYPEEAEAASIVARMAERWQSRLSRFFSHELRGRQPVILYAVGSHFRQTNAIEGLIGEGTGGVTEPLKRRVVLPMSGSLADTDHVLGHELVHAFQFDLTGTEVQDGSGQTAGILAYPLWFVEGMAEYLSLGPVDAQTAMWMRDAALHDHLPSLKDLDNPEYFPYRWGHAFWAYIGARYGDRTVASLIRSAANPRFDLPGLARQLGTDPAHLDEDWHAAIRQAAQAAADEQPPVSSEARLVIGPETGARYNIGPRISPDGKQIAFFSERDRFSIDLYLADAESGRVERRLLKSATDPHFDSLEFLNSAGAWSPDGRTLAITAVRGGRPVIALINPANGGIRRELKLPGLDDAVNPSFAPDGKSIVISGNSGGLIDLYRLWLDGGRLDRLTRDPFADLEAVFTPDGRSLVFVTERYSTDLETLTPGPLRLAIMDLATKEVRPIPGFLTGKHLSPQVSPDGRTITFIADPDGIANLYRMSIDGGPIDRLSAVPTGIAGITNTSPALSLSSGTGRLAFSLFENDGHSIYVLEPSKIVALIPPAASRSAAVLPGRTVESGDLDRLLTDEVHGLPTMAAIPNPVPYNRKLTLDFLGQPTVSGGVSRFGGRVAGGMSASFGDMLGDRLLGVSGQIGGTTKDFGGEIAYLNRRHRWNWEDVGAVVPYATFQLAGVNNPAANTTTITQVLDWQISHGVFGLTAYPFNASTRVEFSGSAQAVTHSADIDTAVYTTSTGQLSNLTKTSIAFGQPLYLATVGAALVKDTSFFGATAPIYGGRSRIEVDRTVGSLDYFSVVADWRRYFFIPARAMTVAIRALHYGRYGAAADDGRLVPIYAGYPEFVHGYGVGSFSAAECLGSGAGAECGVFKSLIGSRMLVANIGVSVPLKGLLNGRLEYGRIPIDLAAFYDAGVIWTGTTLPAFLGGSRQLLRSVGGAVRVNVFGLFVAELAITHPYDRVDRGLQWQVGIRQGF